MTARTITRRTRSAMALAASAALLSLAACGTDGGESESPSPQSGTEASDGGAEQAPPADDGSTSDGGDDQTSDEDDTTDDRDQDDAEDRDGADDPAAGGERTGIMLATELELDDSSGDGPLTVPGEQLASMLGAPFDATAECREDLVLEPGGTASCMGPAGFEQTDPEQEWIAHAVRVPQAEDPAGGSRDAVLFSTGSALPEEADDLTQEDLVLTGVGFGSAYGMEPLSAEDVAEGTLSTLTSEHAYVPVAGMADWSEVTCEDGLDFARFETVDCEATSTDGQSWELTVAPGTYVDNDQGLLVGIDPTPES